MKSIKNDAAESRFRTELLENGSENNGQVLEYQSNRYQRFESDGLASKIQTWIDSYKNFISVFEKYLALIVVICFIVGVLISGIPGIADGVFSAMDGFIEFYGLFAPLIIFIILAPSLAQMVNARKGKRSDFISYAIFWLSVRRLLSLFWAVLFTWFVFDLSFYGGGSSGSLITSLKTTGQNLIHMFLTSHYFYAMYLAVASLLVAKKYPRYERFMRKILNGVENMGQYFIPIIPVFMLSIGIYVSQIDTRLNDQIVSGYNEQINSLLAIEVKSPEINEKITNLIMLKEKTVTEPTSLKHISIFGWEPEMNSDYSMVWIYVLISLVIGLACILWHFGLLVITKVKVKDFSIKEYFKGYWSKVYPLLWATSSEALATPLNLYLVKRHYPKVRTKVRQFTIGVGSYLSINGTMICVIVLAGAVANILGVDLTAIQLFLSIPMVFLIGFGVPGIPGELLLFGGPLLELFDLSPEVQPVFLALYLGLQIGLPDSFRTGNNSTDDCVMSILLNEEYKNKFSDDRLYIDELLEDSTLRRLFASQFAEQFESFFMTSAIENNVTGKRQPLATHREKHKKVKEERKIRILDRRAVQLANLHTVISSPRGEFFRFRLLQMLEREKSLTELLEQKEKEPIKELSRHLRMLQEFSLVAEMMTDGKRMYKRTTKGEATINALRALGRRVGEETFSSILHANFGVNSIRFFLRTYGYKKDLDLRKPQVEFTPYEVGKIALFLRHNVVAGVSVIDKLSSTGILVYLEDGTIRLDSKKAQALFQYWVDLNGILNRPILYEFLFQPSSNGNSSGSQSVEKGNSVFIANGEKYVA